MLSKGEEVAVQELRDCLYHSKAYKSRFQSLLNILRGTVIPEKYVRKVTMKVCLCKTAGDYLDDIIQDRHKDGNAELKETVSPEVLVKKLGLIEENTEQEKTWSNILEKLDMNKSILRFAFLLADAFNGSFEHVDPPRPKPAEPKPKLIVETITLPIRTSYVSFMIGKNGANLKVFLKAINTADCQVQVVKHRRVMKDTTECTIKTRSPEILEKAKDILITAAKDTEKKRELADKKTKQFYENKHANAVKRRNAYETGIITSAQSVKESNRDNFVKKHIGQRQDYGKRQARPKPPPVLEDCSRCMNCLTPYTAAKLKEHSCTYHSGYIFEKEETVPTFKYSKGDGSLEVVASGNQKVIVSEKMWSCCEVLISDTTTDDQALSHADTGCCNSLHNFRLTKSTKSSKNIGAHCASGGGGRGGAQRREKSIRLQPASYMCEEDDDEYDVDEDNEFTPPKTASLGDFITQKLL